MSSRTRDYADRHPRNRRKPAGGGGGARARAANAPRGGGPTRTGLPAWAWMVVGLSAGLLVAVFVYISRPAEPMAMAPSTDTARKAEAIELPPKEPSRFAFYEMLPSYEVVVSDEVLNAPPPPKPRPVPPRPADAVAAATPAASTPPPPAENPSPAATPLPRGPRASGAEHIAALQAAVAAEERERKSRLAAAKPAATPPEARPAAPAPVAGGRERWLIQVAAYRSRADADQQRAALALLGLSAAVEQVTIDQRETWYRVRVGPYGDAAAAQSAQRTLQAQGLKGVVMKIKS